MRLIIADPDLAQRVRLRPVLKRIGGARVKLVECDGVAELPDDGAEKSVLMLSDELVDLGRHTISKIMAANPTWAIVVIGPDDTERMNGVFKDGARAYVRRAHVAEELPQAVETVAKGGVQLPPTVNLKPSSEPIMTHAGPVPAGFFREDGAQQLTPRQREVLAMLRAGWSNAQIARATGVALGTVKIHITAVFKALGVRNRIQASVAAEKIDLPEIGAPPALG